MQNVRPTQHVIAGVQKPDGDLVAPQSDAAGQQKVVEASAATLLALLQSLVEAGRIKVDGEFTIEQLGQLIVEQVKVKNAAGEVIDPAKEDGNLADIKAALQAITGTGYTIKTQAVNAVTGTAQDLIAAVAGKKIYVVGGRLTVGVADGQITLLSNATPIDYVASLVVGSVVTIPPTPMTRPEWQTATGEALKITTQATQTVSGKLLYIEV